MNKRIAAVAAVVTLSATLAFAGPGEGRKGRHGHGKHGKADFSAKLAQKLDLTADQQRLIQDIKKNSYAQHKAFFETSRQTMKEAHTARKANDTAKLEALKATIESQREQMKQIRASEETQVLSVLTAEQRTRYEALKAERKAKHENRGDRGYRKPRG